MTDFQPYRPRNPSPWPKRLALALLIGAAALLLYAFSAWADGGTDPTQKPWPPAKPNYSYVCKHRPEIVKPALCYRPNSRRPYRP